MSHAAAPSDGEVRILIIARNPKALKNTCEFMQRRGWPTVVFSNLAEATEQIRLTRPDIVLISFNHPSETIFRLPELLDATGEFLCVGFVEGTDVISSNTLTAIKMRHKIFGQPSGPNIYRGLEQILSQTILPRHRRALDAVKIEQKPELKPIRDAKATAKAAISSALGKIWPGHTDQPSDHPLTQIEKIGVFRFDSPELPGYLVLAQSRETDSGEILKICGSAIQKAFQTQSVPGHFGDGFWMTCPKVSFETWARSSSAFNLSFEHDGSHIGVAFFQSSTPLPKPRPVKGQKMMGIGLEQIAVGEPLPFKLYLHLKNNDRFFLYLRDGRPLQSEQKQRLIKSRVDELFIRTPDLESLNQFWAQTYLRESLNHSQDKSSR